MNGLPTNKKKALIVGGIGGPFAAMALQLAGIEAVIYEAYDAPSDYAGLFLNTASNGLDVLRTLGIAVPARADGFPIPRMRRAPVTPAYSASADTRTDSAFLRHRRRSTSSSASGRSSAT